MAFELAQVTAHGADEAVALYEKHGFVCIALNVADNDNFQTIAHNLKLKMSGQYRSGDHNRGAHRVCTNSPQNIFDDDYYELLEFIMQPGKMLFHVMLRIEDTLQLDTCGGDYVGPWAPASRATYWHQDWDACHHVVAVSVIIEEITLDMAPLVMATESTQVPIVGPAGLIVVRDVAVWHRGSINRTDFGRPLPCFRFSTAMGRTASPDLARPRIRNRHQFMFYPHLQHFINTIIRPPTDTEVLDEIANDDRPGITILVNPVDDADSVRFWVSQFRNTF